MTTDRPALRLSTARLVVGSMVLVALAPGSVPAANIPLARYNIEADSFRWNINDNRVTASGAVALKGPSLAARSQQLEMRLDDTGAQLQSFRATTDVELRVQERIDGPVSIGRGQSVEWSAATGVAVLKEAASLDLPHPKGRTRVTAAIIEYDVAHGRAQASGTVALTAPGVTLTADRMTVAGLSGESSDIDMRQVKAEGNVHFSGAAEHGGQPKATTQVEGWCEQAEWDPKTRRFQMRTRTRLTTHQARAESTTHADAITIWTAEPRKGQTTPPVTRSQAQGGVTVNASVRDENDEPVTISARAERAEWRAVDDQAELSGAATARIRGTKGDSTITGQTIAFQLAKRHLDARDSVKATSGETVLTADRVVADLSAEGRGLASMLATGNASFHTESPTRTGDKQSQTMVASGQRIGWSSASETATVSGEAKAALHDSRGTTTLSGATVLFRHKRHRLESSGKAVFQSPDAKLQAERIQAQLAADHRSVLTADASGDVVVEAMVVDPVTKTRGKLDATGDEGHWVAADKRLLLRGKPARIHTTGRGQIRGSDFDGREILIHTDSGVIEIHGRDDDRAAVTVGIAAPETAREKSAP